MLTLWMGEEAVYKWGDYSALNETNDSMDMLKNLKIGLWESKNKLFLSNFGILWCTAVPY